MIVNIVKYSFFQNSLLIGVTLGLLLPFIGVIVLSRKMANVADAIGHINMSGITFAYFLNGIIATSLGSTFLITLVWSILGSFLIEYFRGKYENSKEVAIMVVYSLAVALSVIFLNVSRGVQASFNNILFGNINTIPSDEIYWSVGVIIVLLIILILNYKKIMINSIDDNLSKLYGVSYNFYRYFIIILVSLSITMAIKMLGVLLVSSLILIPNLAAIRISKSLKWTLIYAIIFTEISVVMGIFLAYYLNLATSAVIVLIAIIIYLGILFVRKND